LVLEATDIKKARSSTQRARCGKTLLTHRPQPPCCWKAKGLFMTAPGVEVTASTCVPGSNFLPWRFSSSGL
jgi:hypothetical protein